MRAYQSTFSVDGPVDEVALAVRDVMGRANYRMRKFQVRNPRRPDKPSRNRRTEPSRKGFVSFRQPPVIRSQRQRVLLVVVLSLHSLMVYCVYYFFNEV